MRQDVHHFGNWFEFLAYYFDVLRQEGYSQVIILQKDGSEIILSEKMLIWLASEEVLLLG